jgi:hypothetical protein
MFHLDGHDLRACPIEHRKALLRAPSTMHVVYDWFTLITETARGADLFEQAGVRAWSGGGEMAEEGCCEICGNRAEYIPDDWFPVWRCPRCGDFDYDRSLGWRKINSLEEMVQLSGWVREQNAAGVVPVRITQEISRRVAHMQPPGLRERASRVLAKLARDRSDSLFIREAAVRDPELQGWSYSLDEQDVDRLIRILIEDESLRFSGASCGLTVKGLLAAEALQTSGSNSAQGFVAMWFDASLGDAWTNGFDPAIRAAGFRPFRIDIKDYVGGITDEIMAEVRRSRFVVADYTGQVSGVYFEAGFALGLGLTVIPTCRTDEIAKLHFDIRHLNTFVWTTPAELAEALPKRIRAVVGIGPDAADRR